MNGKNRAARCLRFLRHWQAAGIGDAKRRCREEQEDERIREARTREFSLPPETDLHVPGDYTAFLTPDIRLCSGAQEEISRVIRETGAELVYTDEFRIQNSEFRMKDTFSPEEVGYYFKPDYGPDSLRGCNAERNC